MMHVRDHSSHRVNKSRTLPGDAELQAQADASWGLSMPVGSHGSGAWRFLVGWQALHAPAAKASTPFERRSWLIRTRAAPRSCRARDEHRKDDEAL